MSNDKRFTEVDFERFFPAAEVGENEVYMSFVNDEDAIAFRYWWDDIGAALFSEWLQIKRANRK